MFDTEQINHKKFWDEGYLILRSILDSDEISRYREHASSHPFAAIQPDLLSNELYRNLVADERICSIAAKILQDIPVYFGDSAVTYGTKAGGWHKDNASRYNPDGEDWKSSYPIIRFGMYLQDHANHSGGTSVRHRSHMSPTRSHGKPVYLDAAIGDVAVWHLRTTHRASCSLFRGTTRPIGWSKLDRHLPAFMKQPAEADRYAIFITYGSAGPDLERYISYMATRDGFVARAAASSFDTDWASSVDSTMLVLRDTRQELLRLPPEKVSKYHHES